MFIIRNWQLCLMLLINNVYVYKYYKTKLKYCNKLYDLTICMCIKTQIPIYSSRLHILLKKYQHINTPNPTYIYSSCIPTQHRYHQNWETLIMKARNKWPFQTKIIDALDQRTFHILLPPPNITTNTQHTRTHTLIYWLARIDRRKYALMAKYNFMLPLSWRDRLKSVALVRWTHTDENHLYQSYKTYLSRQHHPDPQVVQRVKHCFFYTIFRCLQRKHLKTGCDRKLLTLKNVLWYKQ